MATIDLDAARAARAEALQDLETPNAVFHGVSFDLPRELPFGVFLRMAEMKEDPEKSLPILRAIVESLFGERTDEFLDLSPSLEDMLALVTALVESYDVSTPES